MSIYNVLSLKYKGYKFIKTIWKKAPSSITNLPKNTFTFISKPKLGVLSYMPNILKQNSLTCFKGDSGIVVFWLNYQFISVWLVETSLR